MPRRAMLVSINKAWKLRAAGSKRRAMVASVGVEERQIGNYLNSSWVLRQKEFVELSFKEWTELTPSLQKIHPQYAEYGEQQRKGESSNRQPSMPIQQEAYARCQIRSAEFSQGDHQWFWERDREKYEGVAYTVEVVHREQPENPWPESGAKKICYFCSFQETRWSVPINPSNAARLLY